MSFGLRLTGSPKDEIRTLIRLGAGDEITVGIRPEHIQVVPAEKGDFDVVTDVAEQLGDVTYVHTGGDGETSLVIGRRDSRHFVKGERVGVVLAPARTLVFDSTGNRVRIAQR